ncbi:hypothetical protein [Aeromonas caviae]|uniref:hypothetical protein n=1 Tax=Aeromonas caviae TaxID=648 RepID=UPI0029D5716E|nr:hypothetical protein [Aeromonas caviae]MDX7711848.1 hypothetical protein [Aeromonas caviae]
MAYGIQIFEDDGTNFTETYSPFNIVDQFEVSGSGTRYYEMAPGESLAVVEISPVNMSAAGVNITIAARDGRVYWPVDGNSSMAAGEYRAMTESGRVILVVKRR